MNLEKGKPIYLSFDFKDLSKILRIEVSLYANKLYLL